MSEIFGSEDKTEPTSDSKSFLSSLMATIAPALVLFFLIISANNAGDIFSCQLRVYLKNNMWIKHVLGFFILYIFVISQNSFGTQYQHPTLQLGISLLIYIWFIAVMRAPLEITVVSLSLVFVIYLIHVHQVYYYPDETFDTDPISKQMTSMKTYIFIGASLLSVAGIYFFNAKCQKLYGSDFNYKTYLLGLNNDQCYKTSKEDELYDEEKQKILEDTIESSGPKPTSVGRAKKMFNKIDNDKNGTIEYPEFVEFVKEYNKRNKNKKRNLSA